MAIAPVRSEAHEAWPYLDGAPLVRSRSHRLCMTCHWFRHQAGADGVPLLTCQWHRGLISHGDHLTHRCPGWTRHRHESGGWCPEAA